MEYSKGDQLRLPDSDDAGSEGQIDPIAELLSKKVFNPVILYPSVTETTPIGEDVHGEDPADSPSLGDS